MAILKRLFLVFLLNLFLPPCFAIAAPLSEGSYTYTINAGKASITGYTGSGSEIVIPAQIGGYLVESISNGAFGGLISLERVELSEGIKRIGSSAFADCENLEDIILPDSLISLGSDAFFNCNKLKKLTIPPNTTEIGSWPYFQCNVLEAILVDDDNQEYVSLDGVLFSKDMKTLIRYPQGKKDSAYCIPEGVVTIGDAAFMDCQNLETISVATTVTQIDAWAFNGCTNIKQFIVPNGVTSIGSRAFDQSGITSITFPESVEEWGTCVLWSNVHLEQIEFLDESPSDALSRCIIEDELVMPNLETIYVPYGTKREYEGVLEEYFHSYIQEREESLDNSTPTVPPAHISTYNDVIYNLSWLEYKNTLINLGLKSGSTVKIIDLVTEKAFDIYVQATGNHADVEPLTAADTAIMCNIFGVNDASNIGWKRRPIIVSIGDVQVLASMHGEPHGQQIITNNNFNGVFCVFFKDCVYYPGVTNQSPEDHQAVIQKAMHTLLSMKSSSGKDIIVSLTFPGITTQEPTVTPTPAPTPTVEPTPAFSDLGDIFGNLESAGKYPLKRPTLILSEDGQDLLGVGYLSFEIIETSEKAVAYEVDLYDAWGREIALPGECKLIFPYPEGITINNYHGWRVTITHYNEDQTTKYSSEDGSIEFLPLGLCIRVSSLSPFVIEWEENAVPDNLPQTGDNTSLPMHTLVLLLSLAVIYRLNRKRINA